MARTKGLVVGVAGAALLAVAVLALRGALAQDGLPDLSGTWGGTSKGRESSLDPATAGGTRKSPFTAAFAQSGKDLAVTLTVEESPPVDLAGVAGNGTFWAVSGDPASPLLLVGHANGNATRLKGGVLQGDAGSTLDGQFKAGK